MAHIIQELSTTSHIQQRHLDEWVRDSVVSEEITRLNLESLDNPDKIAQRLNWKSYQGSPGWWVSGVDPATGERRKFGQFKPDTPIQFPDNDKLSKYLSGPKGSPSEAIFLDVGVSNYWKDLQADPSQMLLITEGSKKAASGLTVGLATVALTGVWNGQVDKRKLIPDLQLFAVPGRPVCLCFDSDVLVKESVQQALSHLGKLLKKAGCVVTVAQLPPETKGMDDFIVAHGGEAFKAIMGNAIAYEDWIKGLEGQVQPSGKSKRLTAEEPPQPSVVARELAERYQQQLAWNDEAGCWYRYESEHLGIWSSESDRAVEGVIAAELDQKISEGYSLGYLRSVSGLMQRYLLVKRWNQQAGLLPLQNGVLKLAGGKFLDHSPGYRLTWQLPYRYNPLATCEPVQRWMLEAMGGDAQMVELLRAYLKAIVTGRTDLQRYVECLGPAASGKSTYQRLAIALVGLENTVSVELKHLEGSRFEVAEIYGKKLILINDSDRYGGSVNNLKAITGGDRLRGERKNVQGIQGFFASGMVLVAANEAIQSADYTSGLERRRLTIPFLKPVAPAQRRDLITITEAGTSGDFVEYLPGLLNWVLALPDEDVSRLILDTAVNVPSLSRWKAESLVETNPIAEWLDSRVVVDSEAKTYVGIAKRVRVSTGEPGNTISREKYEQADRWLYASYVDYCQINGSKPVSNRRFSGLLLDLCRNQLQLEVAKSRDEQGSHFCGLAIRDSLQYHGWPRPITGDLEAPAATSPPSDDPPPEPDLTDDLTDPDGWLMAETLTTEGTDASDGLFNNLSTESETSSRSAPQSKTDETDVSFENNPSVPSESNSGNGSNHQPTDQPAPVNPSVTPSTNDDLRGDKPEQDHWTLSVGDRVTVTSPGKYQGQAGRVAGLDLEDGTYRVELDTDGEGWWRSDHLQVEGGEQCPIQPDPKLDADEWEEY